MIRQEERELEFEGLPLKAGPLVNKQGTSGLCSYCLSSQVGSL